LAAFIQPARLRQSPGDLLGWSASFAVFTHDRKNLAYWMPSLFRASRIEREAELAGHSAGVEFIEQIDY
jgi:hypothetical protein